jgi:hypothetical protein
MRRRIEGRLRRCGHSAADIPWHKNVADLIEADNPTHCHDSQFMSHLNFHAISDYTYHGYVTPVQALCYLRLASIASYPLDQLAS